MTVYLVIRVDEENWQLIKAFTTKELALEYKSKFDNHHKEDAGGGDWHEYFVEDLEILDTVPEVRWVKRWQDYKDMQTKKYIFELEL